MKNKKFISLKAKLILLICILTVIPIILISVLSFRTFKETKLHASFEKLSAIAELKTKTINSYFEEKEALLQSLENTPFLDPFLERIENDFQSSGMTLREFLKTPHYDSLIESHDIFLKEFQRLHAIKDILIITDKGNVIYSTKRNDDFGSNLINGKYRGTNLAQIATRVLKGEIESGLSDYHYYEPANSKVEAFLVHVIRKRASSKIHGVVAFQLALQDINKIMADTIGLGATGDVYLVGSDFLMRSDTRLMKESTILTQEVRTEGVIDVFNRKQRQRGVGFCKNLFYEDYRGVKVLGHNHYLPKQDWALMIEIDEKEVLQPVVRLRWQVIVMVAVFVTITTLIGVLISTRLSKPIILLSEVSNKVSKGDLTENITITSNDEVGELSDSFNSMVSGLSETIRKIQKAVHSITTASQQILSGAQEHSANVREQSAAVNETSAAASELTASAEQVGSNIREVARSANHVLVGMAKIKDAIEETSLILSSLNEKSQKIGEITELIDNVAERTNLLAVNAAIEAVRAGEQGKGFTVVADQIQRLADSTAQSTKDIKSVIELIQHEMSNAILSMEKSTISVNEEIELTQSTDEKAKEIALSVNQQISGTKQIAEAMSNINDAMKQVTVAIQQTQDAAGALAAEGHELKSFSEKFKIDDTLLDGNDDEC